MADCTTNCAVEIHSLPQIDPPQTHPFHDSWAAIAFLAGCVVLHVQGTSQSAAVDFTAPENVHVITYDSPIAFVAVLSASCFTACCGAFGLLYLIMKHTENYVLVATAQSTLLTLAMTVLYFTHGAYFSASWFVMLSVLSIIWCYSAAFYTSLISNLLKRALTAVWGTRGGITFMMASAMSVVLFRAFNEVGIPARGPFFQMLVHYWILQVMINTVHITVSGVVASNVKASACTDNELPSVCAPATKALTTHIGSVCLASLAAAVLQSAVVGQGWTVSPIELSASSFVLYYLLMILQRIVLCVNSFALSHAALHGVNYVGALRRILSLAIDNRHLCAWAYFGVSRILWVAGLLNSAFVGFIVGGVEWSVDIGLAASLMSLSIHCVVFQALDAGVTTILMAQFDGIVDVLSLEDKEATRVLSSESISESVNSPPLGE